MGMMNWKIGVCKSLIVLVALSIVAANTNAAAVTTDGCSRKCGEIEIPYPFGLVVEGEPRRCYREEPFQLICNLSYTPPRLFQGPVDVISISVPAAKMGILLDMSFDCYFSNGTTRSRTWNFDLAYPYTFSYTENVFTGIGCDTLAKIQGPVEQSFTGGCISGCDGSSSIPDSDCSGIGCCQAAVPKGLQQYNTSFGRGNNHSNVQNFNPCSYSFLVQKGNYSFRRSDLWMMDPFRLFPVVLDWSIDDSLTCREAIKNRTSYACISSNSVCLNATSGKGYICNCSQGFQGNPYIIDGCQDIDECKDPDRYPCNGTCNNLPGSYTCTCPAGTTGDPNKSGCQRATSSTLPIAILVPVVVALSLLAMGLSFWVHSLVQRRKLNKLKEKYFLQNGGKLLQRRIYSGEKSEDIFKIFKKEEIEKATNKYDQTLILGRGGQGVVYKGSLPNDSRTFAIKKSIVIGGSNIEEFINELIILSKVNHRNVVKLVGCCLEMEEPLLVYEYIENGTLCEHIKSGSLPWNIRLKIAAETAGALAYLHSSTNTPIIHRDVKTSNILLNTQYVAKISDFGASKLVPLEETHVQTVVMGTLGYLDPEYMLTHELTEKSDVYSFGIVLVELLTGRTPISYDKTGVERCLATHFLSCMKHDQLEQILDHRILDTQVVSQMKEVAQIAKSCLNTSGENRPQMTEVAMELEGLRRRGNYAQAAQNTEEIQSLVDISCITTDDVGLLNCKDETCTYSRQEINAFQVDRGR